MALDINDLTYQQLYNTTLARIKALCYNIDSNRLPEELKSGYDKILEKVGDTEYHAKLQYTVKNAVSVVTTATVTQQLQAWLTARGIWANRAQKATPRGVLNYFNCISVFCRAHILVASSELVDTGYPVYVTSGKPEAIDSYTEPYLIASREPSTTVEILTDIIGGTTGSYIVKYNQVLSCSCCSSSSCSSSSCSSSSFFIAYMNL